MAYPEENMVALLKAHVGTLALVGARIRPVQAPDYDGHPMVVYERTTTEFYNSALGMEEAAQCVIEVSCIANTYAGVKALAKQVRLALGGQTDASGWLWHIVEEHDAADVPAPGETYPAAYLSVQTYVVQFGLEQS